MKFVREVQRQNGFAPLRLRAQQEGRTRFGLLHMPARRIFGEREDGKEDLNSTERILDADRGSLLPQTSRSSTGADQIPHLDDPEVPLSPVLTNLKEYQAPLPKAPLPTQTPSMPCQLS